MTKTEASKYIRECVKNTKFFSPKVKEALEMGANELDERISDTERYELLIEGIEQFYQGMIHQIRAEIEEFEDGTDHVNGWLVKYRILQIIDRHMKILQIINRTPHKRRFEMKNNPRSPKDMIDDMREIVKPRIGEMLLEADYEGQGKSDKAEFEYEFETILKLAESALGCTVTIQADHEQVKRLQEILEHDGGVIKICNT